MEKYDPSALSLKSFSYRKISRRIRQAVVSCQRMCEHRKDIPSSLLIYKQFRHPIWRLKYYSAYTDPRHAYPKSRRIINLVSDPYRKLSRHVNLVDDGFLGYMPITSTLRTRPKYSIHDRRPLRYSPRPGLRRFSPPRLVVPPIPLRRYQTDMPLRSVTRDHDYLYDTRTGRTNESSDLGLKTRLLCRTSSYMFPILNGQPENPRATTRLAERMMSLYANRSMESETSRNFGLQSRLVTHDYGYRYAQFSGSRDTGLGRRLNSSLYLDEPISFRPRSKFSPVKVPRVLNSRSSDWSKPFLPNKILGPGRTSENFRRVNYDQAVTTSYVGLPKRSLHIRETELANSYKPTVSTTKDLFKFSKSLEPTQKISGINRRFPGRSEVIPVSDDVASLRLRLSMKLSSSSMSRLYPNENLLLSNLDLPTSSRSKKVFKEIEDELNDDLKAIANARMYLVPPDKKRLVGPPRMTYYNTKDILKPALPPRKRITYPHYYPPGVKTNEEKLVLRPIPGHDLKLRVSNIRKGLPCLEDDEDSDVPSPRLLSSANNYSQLYVAHPENLPSSELGQRLKLSLRSSTSKVADLYASYAAPNTLTPPPSARRKKTQSVKSMVRSWKVPSRYSVDSYVPRPGIIKSAASRDRSNLHGLP